MAEEGCNKIRLSAELSLSLPSRYNQLSQETEWPNYEDLKIEEEMLTGQITTVTMGQVRQTACQKQRGTHWGFSPDLPRPRRTLQQCKRDANEELNIIKTVKRKKRPTKTEVDSDDGSDLSSKKVVAKMGKILEEWESMDFTRVSSRQWTLLKQAAVDHLGIRTKLMDAATRKNWSTITKKEVPKAFKARQTLIKRQTQDARRLAELCKREVKNEVAKSERELGRMPLVLKRMVREMLTKQKKAERQSADLKRQAEKAEAGRRKKEEEEREKKRQAQRLNFLLSQTELYSHFMSKKLGITDQPSTSAPDGMYEEAKGRAERAVEKTMSNIKEFDAAFGRQTVPRSESDSLTQPSSMPESSTVQQPRNFRGILKSYQLKGLQWLVNLYEQGLNGILADEMGLGKTIQAIAFLGHLAEEKSIWGPFLIIAPASTLHNWDNELQHFCPELKVLPYWGHNSDRKILRQCFNPRKLYSYHSPFHVAVTSYQILVQDETYLKRVKWQYLILDEAQAIKSSTSVRWKTLLSFTCRNRILLTGTPIQNNLAELWALLHFIMPTLFDNMDQFSDWFSKDLENFAEGSQELNKEQLKRLHSILSPFMLRRVKADVASELVSKHERVVYCDLSRRQRELYHAIQENLNLSDLFDTDDKKVVNLMNLVVQLRKVCNHPELFEEQTEKVPFHMASLVPNIGTAAGWSGRKSALNCLMPRCLADPRDRMSHSQRISGTLCFLVEPLKGLAEGSDYYSKWIGSRFEIFESANVHWSASLKSVLYLADMASSEARVAKRGTFLEGWLVSGGTKRKIIVEDLHYSIGHPLVKTPVERLVGSIDVIKSVRKGFVPPAISPPPTAIHQNPLWVSELLFGPSLVQTERPRLRDYWTEGGHPLLSTFYRVFGSAPQSQMYALAKSLIDSGKMLKLDELLKKLKAEGHRVLLFSQMTMMMNILEDYLSFRRFRYLRLDGQSMISDRRDMVRHFQTNPDIFVFLLSTRAGGLGINLTAADTVIFYESDWNPTMDMQAMDRAHRLGQTKDVTVYRFVCRDTIEENIIRRAREKETVQQLVMTGQTTRESADVFAPEDVVSILLNNKDPVNQQRRSGIMKRWPMKTKILMKGESIEIAHEEDKSRDPARKKRPRKK